MKLYYTPGVCSLAPHIALREAGLDFDLVKVDLRSKQMEDGGDYKKINKQGKVPALDIGESEVLTENPAILQYIADKAPDRGLAPPPSDPARYRLQSWLSYLGSEVHKLFGPLFTPGTPEETKNQNLQSLHNQLAQLDEHLSRHDYIMGDHFTVADGYLFTILGWPRMLNIDLSKYANLGKFVARVGQRAPVQAALKAEGLA